MSETLRIATRKSPLAMWQAEHVADRLRRANPGLEVDLVAMKTQGDKILDTPLAKIGGKGLFVKELEQGMAEGRADIAVHSMKDVPAELPEGFDLPVIMDRENPRDAFVSNQCACFDDLPRGARLGTASLRRQCQAMARRPDLEVLTLRGNVNTRLRKLDEGEFDAIMLASAGLMRLGFDQRITALMEPEESLPAIGQGALGIECRAGDDRVAALIASLHHEPTAVPPISNCSMRSSCCTRPLVLSTRTTTRSSNRSLRSCRDSKKSANSAWRFRSRSSPGITS